MTFRADLTRSLTDAGRVLSDQALAVPVEPQERLAPSGFDPSRLEYRFSIKGGHERHDWIIGGKLGAIGIWAEPSNPRYGRERWFGGIECHSAQPLEYEGGRHEHCWVLNAPCWHDGSSLQFSEQVEERLPAPNGKPMPSVILDELGPLLRSRFRSWLSEPASAIEARSGETGTGSTEGESAPEGDAR